MPNFLAKAAQELGCEFRNSNSVDLANTTADRVEQWLRTNGFNKSKVREGRWYRGKLSLHSDWLIFDAKAGFLYTPSL